MSAEKNRGILVTENGDAVPIFTVNVNQDVATIAFDHLARRNLEGTVKFRFDALGLQERGGNPGIKRARIHERVEPPFLGRRLRIGKPDFRCECSHADILSKVVSLVNGCAMPGRRRSPI